MAINLPSQTELKVKDSIFLTQRLPQHARLGSHTKSWPIFPWQLIKSELWSPLGAIGGASSLLTAIRVTVLLFQSDWPTPVTPPWPLQNICLMFMVLWTICSLTVVSLFFFFFNHKSYQKNGLGVEVLSGPSTLPTIERDHWSSE